MSIQPIAVLRVTGPPEPGKWVGTDGQGSVEWMDPPPVAEVVDSEVADLLADPASVTRTTFAAQDLTLSRGRTPNDSPVTFGIRRDFDSAQGDLFTSDTRLTFRVGRQQSSDQNPPGYSMGEITLTENRADQASPYQGETVSIKLITSRVLINRRLEVDMGGTGRATLRSGTNPSDHYARLQLHNETYPRFTIYGPQDGTNPSRAIVDRAELIVDRGGSNPFRVVGVATDGSAQEVQVTQFGAGHQLLRGLHSGQMVGQIRFEHSDGSLRLSGANRVQIDSPTTINGGLTLSAGSTVRNGTAQILSTRQGGWGSAFTGTFTRTAFDTETATVTDVARRLAALLVDLRAHGLIGN